MTPQESYAILDKVAATVTCDRANHKLLEKALAVYAALIAPPPADPE